MLSDEFAERKTQVDGVDDFSQIEALLNKAGEEGDDKGAEEDEEGKEDQGDEEGINEEDYEDEEELVDDNDYAQNYFDNGEGDDIDDDDGESICQPIIMLWAFCLLNHFLGDGGDYY